MKASGWTAIAVTTVLVGGSLYAYAQYRTVWDGITHITVNDLGHRPPQIKNALNILLIGSDSRAGKNRKLGGWAAGQRSDTVMVVHIAPGKQGVSVLSFPRDSVVPILQCPKKRNFSGQSAVPGQIEQLNSTFSAGGPNCLWKTIEQTAHIRLNDFIQLDFTGFVSVINALHGVKVCVPYTVHKNPYSNLKLTKGVHTLDGSEALKYWRLRENFGLGSDLQRIQRDQLLMVGLVQKILKSGILHSVTKTYGIVKDIVDAHALTTDTGLTPDTIVRIARSLAGLSKKSIQFIEVPTITYTPNPNWVQWDPSKAPALFKAIEHNRKLPKGTTTKHGSGTKGAKGSKGSKTTPPPPKLLATSKVSVEVLNGSGVNGIAGRTLAALHKRGFHTLQAIGATTASGAPDYHYPSSVVEYSSATEKAAALTVAAQLTKVTLKQVSTVPAGQIDLILGKDFKTLANANSQPTGNLAHKFGGYNGATNVCKGYGTAFAR